MTESKASQAKRERAEDRAEAKAEQKREDRAEDKAQSNRPTLVAKAKTEPKPPKEEPKPAEPEPVPEPPPPEPEDVMPVEPVFSGKTEDFPQWVQDDMRFKENMSAWMGRHRKVS